MVKFQECVQDAGLDTPISLRLDVSTRWNSTYLMLESAIKYEKAFDLLQIVDTRYKHCPSYEEWRRGEKICEFLEPFYETTNLISGSSYPTSNLYFTQIWKIECLLKQYLFSEDELVKKMAGTMTLKFEKYWSNYSVVLAFGAIVDPRLKPHFLEFCYKKLGFDLSTRIEKVQNIKDKLSKLYQEYTNNFNAPCASQSHTSQESKLSKSCEGSRPKKSKIFSEYKEYKNESNIDIGKSELYLYLDEPQIEYEENEELNVLDYWKNNEKKYPTLSILARDVLSIPITTVASESAFSIGGRVLTKYRSSTLPENVQMLICTRNWLHGFIENAKDDDDDDAKVIGSDVTPLASNENQEDED